MPRKKLTSSFNDSYTMQVPSISVILPTYNRALTLKRALDSVLMQSYGDFELIVVDDGSVDETQSLLASYKDRRLTVVVQENKGVSVARNRGIEKVRANWIAFIDSDDSWHPMKLEKQWQAIQNNSDIKIIQTEEIWIRRGVRVNPKKKHQKVSGWIFEQCIPLCIVSPSAVMIHRDVFDRCGVFDEELSACEDYDLWLRVSLEFPIITMPDPLITKYGGHDDQLSRKTVAIDRFRIKALKKILSHPKLSPKQRKLVEENIELRNKILRDGAKKRGIFP